ncbi:PST family polysaccharide transporter [Flavobacterium sp. 1]|uniref:O-antigen translocase n=1 Tax=Flavobacterium sp. 1 TaxID=2035200 RepID=UPI000C24613A|nr:O-antigen translocase [Flavobacterium sp. 1]PJJ09049.1 PST family polysaccharide transporter [Flavobacterium sp. 1]
MFKISSLNSLSVILKIGVGLVTSKLLAVFVGPSGMALVGNLRNFMTSLESISTLGFQNGIVKYVTECDNDKSELQKIIATVFISLMIVAIGLSGILFFFAAYWNNQIFGTYFNYSFVFKVLALALPWYAVSLFFVSVVNGLGRFKKVIWITIFGNIIGLLVSLILIWNYQTLGALLATVVSPALLFFVGFYFVNKEIPFLNTIRLHYFDFKIIKNLSSYSLMALVSSVIGPLVYLAIRKNVIATVGIDQAGYWETMNRISSYYMLFASTILSVYFLPKLASAKSNGETKTVFWSYYKSILPLFIVGLFLIYVLRFFIVELLFSKEFLPVASMFFWQLTGDILKVAFLILGYQFFAKKLTLAFIIFEIASLAVLYFLSDFLIHFFGIQGILIAQFLDNLIYLLVLAVYFRKSLF